MSALTTISTPRPAPAARRATVLAEAVVSNYLREISPARPRRAAAVRPRVAALEVNDHPQRLPSACQAASRVRQAPRHTLHGVRVRRGLTVSDPAQAA